MNADIGIENQTEYNEVIETIQKIDNALAKCYNELVKKTKDKDIVDLQNIIDQLHRKRSGYYNLSVEYQSRGSEDKSIEAYYCHKGDTLQLISQIYYGNHYFSEYLYYLNDLTDDTLIPNQKIIIPEISSSADPILGARMIELIEQDRLKRGLS